MSGAPPPPQFPNDGIPRARVEPTPPPERPMVPTPWNRSQMNANWWAPPMQPADDHDHLNAPNLQPRVSQEPMNLLRDDLNDDLTLDTASSRRSTADTVWSFDSVRDIHEFIREVNGRRYNAQNTMYFLPADEVEYDRLDKQHIRHCIALGGELCPRPEVVNHVLRPEPGVQKRILDAGCGTGIWTMSMANNFPHVEVIGVDLAPSVVNRDDMPDNCRFELDDVNRSLQHFYGQIDLVYARAIASGIDNYTEFTTDLIKCLKPGGLLILVEGDFEFYGENQASFSVPVDPDCTDTTQPGKTWLAFNAHEAQKAQFGRGGDIMRAQEIIDRGLWGHPAMDPESCGAMSMFTPIGPWPQTQNPEERQRLSMAGTVERQVIRDFYGAMKNMLLERGIEERTCTRWFYKGELDLQFCGVGRVWNRSRYAWGRKRLQDGTAVPHIPVEGLAYRPIPPHLSGVVPPLDAAGPYGKFPQIHYYPTAERAAQWREWRALERARLGLEVRPVLEPWEWEEENGGS